MTAGAEQAAPEGEDDDDRSSSPNFRAARGRSQSTSGGWGEQMGHAPTVGRTMSLDDLTTEQDDRRRQSLKELFSDTPWLVYLSVGCWKLLPCVDADRLKEEQPVRATSMIFFRIFQFFDALLHGKMGNIVAACVVISSFAFAGKSTWQGMTSPSVLLQMQFACYGTSFLFLGLAGTSLRSWVAKDGPISRLGIHGYYLSKTERQGERQPALPPYLPSLCSV